MKNMIWISLLPAFLTACAITPSAPVYNKEASINNAQMKINAIKDMVAEAERNGDDNISKKVSEARGCTYTGGVSGLSVNDNLRYKSQSWLDLDRLIKQNFLVLKSEHSKLASDRNEENFATYYIIGDGSTELTHRINMNHGYPDKSSCGSGGKMARYNENLYLSSTYPNLLSTQAVFNKDPAKIDEKAFLARSYRLEKSLKNNRQFRNEQIVENREKIAESRAKMAKINADKERREAQMRAANNSSSILNSINKNMEFFSTHTDYVGQQQAINQNNATFNNGSYQPASTYSPPSSNKTTSSQSSSLPTILSSSTRAKPVKAEKNVVLPKGRFETCGEDFTSLYDISNKYREGCKSQYNKSDPALVQCFINIENKAKRDFLNKYESWYGRTCPQKSTPRSASRDQEQ